MNDKKYKLILYVIVFVILGTISIQVYWNYKNYLINKQQLINDVQTSLNNSVEAYYTNLATEQTIQFAFDDGQNIDSTFNNFNFTRRALKAVDSLALDSIKGVSIYNYEGVKTDSIIGLFQNGHKLKYRKGSGIIKTLKNLETDSVLKSNFKILTNRVMISLTNDDIDIKDLDSLFREELNRKNIALNYGLSFNSHFSKPKFIHKENIKTSGLSTSASTNLLPSEFEFSAHFTNETKIVLKRILSGILMSVILVLAVISCLFYLLKIIKHQKQLAEVKNDLISNITHEFKTPIATISVALESIKDFDAINNKTKTKNYLDMSSKQLSKLNVMVEKLLETATLDSENLDLKREEINLVDLLYSLTEKYSMTLNGKDLTFQPSEGCINASIDVFHFENAISNIIDNAIKYGGENITIDIKQLSKQIEITISDNGTILTKAQANRLFEKFYRVPKGNTHDVKGFGIGLYYTRKIIEKHEGVIQVNLNNNTTNFKITLPNG